VVELPRVAMRVFRIGKRGELLGLRGTGRAWRNAGAMEAALSKHCEIMYSWSRLSVVAAAVGLFGPGPIRQCQAGDVPPLPKPTAAVEGCANEGCHAAKLDHKFVHGPVAQQKCEACHQYEEPREHRFKTIKQDQLCSTCHLMEHRTVVHGPVANGQCTGCHDPHGSEYRMMLVADPTKGLCLSCHTHEEKPDEHVHGPVAAGACILCHEPHSAWKPNLLVKNTNELCADCHAEVEQSGMGLHVHEAMQQGCTTCHNPHQSPNQYMLRAPTDELCATCHDKLMDSINSAAVVHGAVHQANGCTGCHSPHSSMLPNLQKKPEPDTCLSCHDKPITTDSGRVLTNMALLLHDSPDHHGPIRAGSCSSCHQPHESANANLLVKPYPPEFYAPFDINRYALCFTCHLPEMVTSKSGIGVTRFRDGDANLHNLHVDQEKGRTCRACHEVHASKRPFHIREAVPFGTSGWMLEINFEALPDGGRCAPGCHVERSYARGELQNPPQTNPSKGGGP